MDFPPADNEYEDRKDSVCELVELLRNGHTLRISVTEVEADKSYVVNVDENDFHDGIFGWAEILRVSAQGGHPELATKISEREEAHRWPYFLPDGRHFVFLGDAASAEIITFALVYSTRWKRRFVLVRSRESLMQHRDTCYMSVRAHWWRNHLTRRLPEMGRDSS
jgi:hypothetical protein